VDRTYEAGSRQALATVSTMLEIGLFKPARATAQQQEMLSRTWDFEILQRSVSWMKFQNGQRLNVFIRPKASTL